MLNYAETTRSRTNVSFTPVPCSQPQVSITEPLSPVAVPLPPSTAEEEREQGREAGRTEFKHLHEQAEQHKGEALTKPEIREVYGTRFLERMQEYERGDLPRDWFEGWCRGIVSATIQAEEAVPLEPVVPDLPLPEPLPLTPVRFRQAIFEVEDAEAFLTGVQCGQVCAVEETQGGMKPLTGTSLFALFEDAIVGDNEEASQTWLAGYVLGLTDALCRKRKYYPRGWW